MAKGAASEVQLGGLHSLLATVFKRTLDKYLLELDTLEAISEGDLGEDLLIAALAEIGEPNPAMLSAISKFLKDNAIGLESDEVDDLNSTARRLAENRKKRAERGFTLTSVPAVAEA